MVSSATDVAPAPHIAMDIPWLLALRYLTEGMKRSTSGYVFLLSGAGFSWRNRFALTGWAQVFRSDAKREDAKRWDGVGPSCCKTCALSRWEPGVLTVGRDIMTSKHR